MSVRKLSNYKKAMFYLVHFLYYLIKKAFVFGFDVKLSKKNMDFVIVKNREQFQLVNIKVNSDL